MVLSQLNAKKYASLFGFASFLAFGCHSQSDDVKADAGSSTPVFDAGVYSNFCDLPGSVQFSGGSTIIVPGANTAKLGFLHLPDGFCAHYFGNVGNARQLRFAPGGELFVASPTTGTTGGGQGGLSAIVLLADDNRDGYADGNEKFLENLPSTQGLLFTPGYFYYQDATKILRMPYASGDRAPSSAGDVMVNITAYSSPLHWPKALDQADDGTIFVGNGGDQGETCVEPHPFHGGIIAIDGSPGGAQVAQGFRNPIAVRCERGKNLCFAAELARDYSAAQGGREKLVPIRQGDDWGFPCCATKDSPFPDVTPAPDCSMVAPEDASFLIGDTPFSFDFEPGNWPAPYKNSAFVPLHGSAGGWLGARVVMVEMDPTTGMPMAGTDLVDGGSTGAMSDFATGWYDEHNDHGRPAEATFAADGRLFIGSDNNGEIFWVAPLDLPRK
jgi:glucose/arabinose dehydrogenase